METEPPNGIDNTDVEDNNIVMFDTDDEDFSDSEMPNRDQTSTEGNLEIDIKRKLEGNHAYCGIVSQAEGFTTIRYSGELILKLATTRDRRTSLRNEFAAYAQLAREKNPFIVEAYGLFTSRLHRSSKTAYEVLILADGGTSLDSRMKLSIYQETKDRIR
jgi:hypothetical protein